MKTKPKWLQSTNTPSVGQVPVVVDATTFKYQTPYTNIKSVTQTNHGFNIGNILYFDGVNYQLANAYDITQLGEYIVTMITDVNTFSIAGKGIVTITDTTFTSTKISSTLYYVNSCGEVLDNDIKLPYSSPIYKVISIIGSTIILVMLKYRSSDNYTLVFVNQGTRYGYIAGTNIISKLSFIDDTNSVSVGRLLRTSVYSTGTNSTTHGYISGGINNLSIDKMCFATDGDSTYVGNLTVARYSPSGHSSMTHCYHAGGVISGAVTATNVIDKFIQSVDSSATSVGVLTINVGDMDGASIDYGGYSPGGLAQPGQLYTNAVIAKFPFAIDINATFVGNLTQGRSYVSVQNNDTFAYISGGGTSNVTPTNIVDKLSFAIDGNATLVGYLQVNASLANAHSSLVDAYTSGGAISNGVTSIVIRKMKFVTEVFSTAVGVLLADAHNAATAQQ